MEKDECLCVEVVKWNNPVLRTLSDLEVTAFGFKCPQ